MVHFFCTVAYVDCTYDVFTANLAPQFTDTTPAVIHAVLGEPTVVPIRVIDPDVDPVNPGTVNITAKVTDSVGEHQLTQLIVGVNSTGGDVYYQSSFTWSPSKRDMYTLELIATDATGATAVMKTEIVLCGCAQLATCDYTQTQVRHDFVIQANHLKLTI